MAQPKRSLRQRWRQRRRLAVLESVFEAHDGKHRLTCGWCDTFLARTRQPREAAARHVREAHYPEARLLTLVTYEPRRDGAEAKRKWRAVL